MYLTKEIQGISYYSGGIVVDRTGRARVKVTIPETIGRYKIYCVGVSSDAKLYGIGDSLITARLPILVSAYPPKFLRYGDTAKIPIMVQNLTEKNLQVKLGIRALNADFGNEKTMELGYTTEVKAAGHHYFNVNVNTISPGKARFQVCCVAGEYGDASEFIIPVVFPVSMTTTSIFGNLYRNDHSTSQLIQIPKNADPSYGGINVTPFFFLYFFFLFIHCLF